jgi:hypothetical protein
MNLNQIKQTGHKMSNNYEFLSYKQYPEDIYTMASCRVRIDKKYILTFVQKKSKDGGMFWTQPSVGVNDGGEKKYLPAHKLDSDFDGEMLIEFIQDSVKKANGTKVSMTGSIQQTIQSGIQAQNNGVAADEQLPF